MNIKTLITEIAPTIATALGGPLAGGATKLLSQALTGKEDATEKEMQQALSVATIEQLANKYPWVKPHGIR